MLFKDIAILDENFDYRAGMYVGIRDDIIDYLSEEPPEDLASYGRIYDGADKLLMPALYNTHSHAPMTLLRGFAENLPLDRWLAEKCWPFEAKITSDDLYWSTLLACAEMSRYGLVGFTDMYYGVEERARAINKLGMKANLCEGLLAFEPKPYSEYPIYAQNEEFFRTIHNTENGRIKLDYNIHAEYTSTPEICQEIAAIVKEKGLRIHLHMSETKKEVQECKERRSGMTPVAYFESIGVLDVPVTAAHCVWMEDGDLDILQDHNVFIANCPVSNMKLGSGFAPIPAMLERDMNVCVGSDGMASNNNHNLFTDLYVMGLIYKGSSFDAAVVDPKQILKAATHTGALSQGREDCGLIKKGYKADLCVLDTTGPQWTPMTAPIYNVIFAGEGSDVVLTMSDGKIVYENGEWPALDLEKVKAEVSDRAARIISEL